MTAQAHEILIIEGEYTSMAFCPPIPRDHPEIATLTDDEIRERTDTTPAAKYIFTAACWRHYVATWELKGGRMYLNDIQGRYRITGGQPIFAEWVTAVLRIPHGRILQQVDMAFATLYEYETRIKVENGVVVQECHVDNRKRDLNAWRLRWQNVPDDANRVEDDIME